MMIHRTTESDSNYNNLEHMSIQDLLQNMNAEDHTVPTAVNKAIPQIEKLVDVLKAFVHQEEEIVHQEIALYKIKTDKLTNGDVEKVIRENYARILTVDPLFMVIEKTGHVAETQLLFENLKPFGILEFARSGRVAVTKPMKELSTYLKELETKN